MSNELFKLLEQKHSLPGGLLDAVWAQESGRGKNMRSPVGAQGHFQFMPATAKQYNLTNPDDLTQSAGAAAQMYGDLLKKYGGDLPKALAAYNWGQGNVDRQGIDKAPAETRGYIDKISSKVQPKAQTMDFTQQIKQAKESGYSDDEILGHLSQSQKHAAKFKQARDAGYSDAEIAQHFGLNVAAKAEAPKEQKYDPTEGMSTTEKVLAGAGKAITDVGRGVGQMVGLVSREDVAESRKNDQALMNTTGGQVGNFAGNVAMLAPTALIPGAATIPGAAIIGGVAGLTAPSTSTKETLANVALGGAGGAAGQAVANKLPGMVNAWSQRSAAKTAAEAAQAAPRFAAAQKGAQAGYVVPPADLNPGVVSEVVSGLSGKIKTAQTASQRNQAVTNKLAARALGLADDVNIDIPTLTNIRNQAGQAYQAVAGAGTVTPKPAYTQALDDALRPFVSRSKSFPNSKVPPIVDDLNALKTNAFDAGDAIETIKGLRNDADAAYRAGDKLAGKAYKQASEALENAIDDHLVTSGAPANMLKAYREARQTIAKTYTVQGALNAETGAINAQKLAADLTKGKPLSGELKDVAKFSTAFPKATQALKETPKSVSPLDFAVAGTSAASTGNPLALALVGARPVARNALLSKFVQQAAMKPGYKQSAMSRLAPAALDNELLRLLAAPVGMTLANGNQ